MMDNPLQILLEQKLKQRIFGFEVPAKASLISKLLRDNLEEKQEMAKPHKPRHHSAYHPIMSKGGVHEKTTKAKRAADKRRLKRELKTPLGDQIGDLSKAA